MIVLPCSGQESFSMRTIQQPNALWPNHWHRRIAQRCH